MGFGGGALIGSPLATHLMDHFGNGIQSQGVWQTFCVMGTIYFVLMLIGAIIIRNPPTLPEEREEILLTDDVPSPISPKKEAADDLTVEEAIKTHQLWLLWFCLLFNVTAGIGILSQASNMIQDIYPSVKADQAANFVVLLSGINMAGRFFWSSLSDYIGRKTVYTIFFYCGCCFIWFTYKNS